MLPLVPIEGVVVGEPEMRHSTNGTAMARFRVKSADRRKDPEADKWVDTDVLWVTVTAFGRLAENVMDSLVDGDHVVAIGRWSTAEWVDQQGVKRSAPRVSAVAIGAGLAWAPRRHSAETMAKHRPQAQPDGRPEQDASHGYGHRYADAAVGAGAPAGGVAQHDPWAAQ